MKKTTTQKKTARKASAPKLVHERGRERDGMNIKQMVVRSAIRQGFRLVELGLIAVGGMLLGIKISF